MPFESNRRDLGIWAAGAILSAWPLGSSSTAAEGPPPLGPGLHNLSMLRPGASALGYTLFVPPTYSASTPVPLILALHFGVGGGSSAGAGRDVLNALIGPALAELGAIIVAPDSVRGNWSTAENETTVNELLDMIVNRYAVDKKRIAVTGYSMGGAGTWHFAEKYPDRFSAAIPLAGTPPASATGWKLPVLAIHSRDDQVIPFGPTEARIAELQNAGVNAKLIALSGISHYETNRFQGALRQSIPWLRDVWK
jgi:predicted peptidase